LRADGQSNSDTGGVNAGAHRKCIATGKVLPAGELMRFVRSPDGEVVPDVKHKLPGRGVWVSRCHEAISDAQKRRLFDRGFKTQCRIDGDLAARTGRLLEEKALGYLALANKAGLVVQGFEKVDAAIRAGKLAVLIAASDGAEDGRSKLKQRLRACESEAVLIENFASDQLGLALGRTNVIHAGVVGGGLQRKFVEAAQNIAAYRAKCL
jgi:predicted RNA-binding protein YlxR (DUF448 family)